MYGSRLEWSELATGTFTTSVCRYVKADMLLSAGMYAGVVASLCMRADNGSKTRFGTMLLSHVAVTGC